MKKEIVFFEDTFGLYGGIERFILNVLHNINLNKYTITIVVNSILSNEYIDELKTLGVEIVQLQNIYIRNPIKRHLIGFKKRKLYLKQHHVETVHFHISNGIDLKYVSIAKHHKVENRISHCHNSSVTSKLKLIFHKLYKLFYKNTPTTYLACSKIAAEWLYSKKTIRKNNYVIINNAIDYERFIYDDKKRNEIRSQLCISNDQIVFIHIGRFNLQKNHVFLINLYKRILEFLPNSKLFLIGCGELKNEIESLTKDFALQNNIEFLEPTNHIEDYLLAADMFLFPSLFEGLPVIGIEAQAASLFTLASDKISTEMKITNYVKFLDLNIDSWTQFIKNFDFNYLRHDMSKEICNSGYSIKTIIKKLEEIYDTEK